MREKYRTTQPKICISRYKLVTEFYMENRGMSGILKRAKNLKNLLENVAVRIDDDEVIVGAQASTYRGCALYPENSVAWLKEEVESRYISTRDLDPYILDEDDRSYILETVDFWMSECMTAKADANMIDEYKAVAANGVTQFGGEGHAPSPVGHYCTGYNTAIRKGFAAIKREADDKIRLLLDAALPGKSVERYNFYRAVSIVCDAMIAFAKRYAKLAQEKLAAESDPKRKAELAMMADSLNRTVEKPARSFFDALQCLFLYQTALCLDANMHGISFGRVDQYLGDFYDADVAAGRLTPEYAQELTDLFYLKVAEMNKPWSYLATQSNPGYSSGQLMTLGGVDKDGRDATNDVTFMMLQSSGRLNLHDPPQALRVHGHTPKALLEAAIETTRRVGGVPTFENDDVIVPALMSRGLSLEDARDYCLIGCVEPAGCGTEWPACGGTGTESYMNLANALILAINDGHTPQPMINAFVPAPPGTPNVRLGPATGYLYDMTSIEEVMDAYKRQIETFVKWHIMNINAFEYVAREFLPNPLTSATMAGCMENGADVMFGGAKYNSTGDSGVGIGNVADSLNIINHCVFEKKVCSARDMHNAIKNNWKGYEELHAYILNKAPHYGNGLPECDRFATFAAKCFSDAVNSLTGPRGRYSAGMYPVTTNVMFGAVTPATPDGRYKGEPLADGIAAPQQMDRNGPTAVIRSVASIKQADFPNGTLMNLKFHPVSLRGEDGPAKLAELIRAYFGMGGMELQINVVSAETLRDAQKNPDKHKELVVRVAGFSAYFVELHPTGQNDLIRRTELSM
jgi:formate C-acetyltransferase